MDKMEISRNTSRDHNPVTDDTYFLSNVSPLALGGNVIYRISYAGSGCWDTYYNYSTLTDTSCGYPVSANLQANNEASGSGGSYVRMPLSYFGSATQNTNSTLRVRGSSGWSDWTTNVAFLESTSGTPQFDYTNLSPYYYFKTVGSST